MNKSAIWTAFAMFIVMAAAFAYCVSFYQYITNYYASQPEPEVRIIHEYDEGYYNGYQNGKAQAIEDAACIIH